MKALILMAAFLLSFTSLALCDDAISPERLAMSVSGGYSHMIGHADPSFFPHDAFYIDMQVLLRVPNVEVPIVSAPLWLGIGSSISSYTTSEDVSGFIGGQFVDASLDSSFTLVSVEARAAIPIRFGPRHGFFVTPSIGAGLLIDNYSFNTLTFPGENDARAGGPDTRRQGDHAGLAFCLRPTIAVGYSWEHWQLGGEASYVAAWGDFGEFGGNVQELHAGLFVRFVY